MKKLFIALMVLCAALFMFNLGCDPDDIDEPDPPPNIAAPPCEYSLWDAYHMCLTSCDGSYNVPKEKETCKSGCMWMWENVRNGNHPSNCHYRE